MTHGLVQGELVWTAVQVVLLVGRCISWQVAVVPASEGTNVYVAARVLSVPLGPSTVGAIGATVSSRYDGPSFGVMLPARSTRVTSRTYVVPGVEAVSVSVCGLVQPSVVLTS